jgi:hypothetical protein
MRTTHQPDLITTREAMKLLNVTSRTVTNLIARGPANGGLSGLLLLNGTYRFEKAAVVQLAEARRASGDRRLHRP